MKINEKEKAGRRSLSGKGKAKDKKSLKKKEFVKIKEVKESKKGAYKILEKKEGIGFEEFVFLDRISKKMRAGVKKDGEVPENFRLFRSEENKARQKGAGVGGSVLEDEVLDSPGLVPDIPKRRELVKEGVSGEEIIVGNERDYREDKYRDKYREIQASSGYQGVVSVGSAHSGIFRRMQRRVGAPYEEVNVQVPFQGSRFDVSRRDDSYRGLVEISMRDFDPMMQMNLAGEYHAGATQAQEYVATAKDVAPFEQDFQREKEFDPSLGMMREKRKRDFF